MGLLDFVDRHKNKFILLGGTAGLGLFVLNKVLIHYEKQWQSSSSRNFVYDVRKKEIHLENITDECNQLSQKLSSRVLSYLRRILDINNLIAKNKTNNKQEPDVQNSIETWKLLKVKILTKLLSEIYSTCLLICYLRLLKAVGGGKIFAMTIQANNKDNSGSSSATVADLSNMKLHTKLNQLIMTLNEGKFNLLIEQIELNVEEAIRGFSMDYKMVLLDFSKILDKIKSSIDFYLTSESFKLNELLIDYNSTLMNDDQFKSDSEDRDCVQLHQILSDAQAILKSNEFNSVLYNNINIGFDLLMDNLRDSFIKINKKMNPNVDSKLINPDTFKLPIVKILPQLIENQSDQRQLINQLLSFDELNCYASNIYDEFCFAI